MRSEKYHVKDLVKQPGKTVAESLGIEVDPKAPGGQKIAPPTRHSTGGGKAAQSDLQYEGFGDVDGWNSPTRYDGAE